MGVYDPFYRLNPDTLDADVIEYADIPIPRILENAVRIFKARQADKIALIAKMTGEDYDDPGTVNLTPIPDANCVAGGTLAPTDLMFVARAAKADDFPEGLEIQDTRIRIDCLVVIPTELVADAKYLLTSWYQYLVYKCFAGIHPVQFGWREQFTGESDDDYRLFLKSIPDTMSFRGVRQELGARYGIEYPRSIVAGIACEIKGYEIITKGP